MLFQIRTMIQGRALTLLWLVVQVALVITVKELSLAAGAEAQLLSLLFAMHAVAGMFLGLRIHQSGIHAETHHLADWLDRDRLSPTLPPCRYLVKKNLDGYVPLIQRMGITTRSPKPKAKAKAPPRPASMVEKPKRAAAKRLDSWINDMYDSGDESDAYMSDQSAARSASVEAATVSNASTTTMNNNGTSVVHQLGGPPAHRPTQHKRSILGDINRSKVIQITSEAQLQELAPEFIGQLLGTSLRIKPRKPLRPTITAVF